MNASLRITSGTNPRAQRHRGPSVAALVWLVVATVPAWAAEPSQLVTNALAVADEMYASERYELALAEYQKVIVADPSHWHASYRIALSCLALYDPESTDAKVLQYADKSAKALEHVMTLEAPDAATAEKVRGYYVAFLMAANKTDRAIAFYEGLLEKDPKNPALLSRLAETYAKIGDFDTALTYYTKRTEIEPANKEAWYTIGVMCWDRVRNSRATLPADDLNRTIATGIDALDKALSMDSGYFEALVYMNLIHREKALVLSVQKDYVAAGDALSKADNYRNRAQEIGKKRMEASADPSVQHSESPRD